MFTGFVSSAQSETPLDSLLLNKIFGESRNNSIIRAASEVEKDMFDDGDSLTYQIVFKENTRLNHEKFLIIIVQADYGSQHGHQIGNTGIYFFQPQDSTYILRDSIIINSQPIGTAKEFDILEYRSKEQSSFMDL